MHCKIKDRRSDPLLCDKLEVVKFFTYTRYQFISTIEFIDQNENLVFHLS